MYACHIYIYNVIYIYDNDIYANATRFLKCVKYVWPFFNVYMNKKLLA